MEGRRSAYGVFMMKSHPQVKKEHPEATFAERTKMLIEKWHCLPEEQKQRFKDAEEQDRLRCLEIDRRSKPRRNRTAYMLFVKEVRHQVQSQNPKANFLEVTGIVNQAWTLLSAEERQKYNAMAAQDRERYVSERRERCVLEVVSGPESNEDSSLPLSVSQIRPRPGVSTAANRRPSRENTQLVSLAPFALILVSLTIWRPVRVSHSHTQASISVSPPVALMNRPSGLNMARRIFFVALQIGDNGSLYLTCRGRKIL